jgi:hypothetical protein
MELQITQFSSILELIENFPTEQSCIDHLEAVRWGGVVVSPFDSNSKVYKCKGNKYKCKNTGLYFNVRTATIFDNTKLPLKKWFMAIFLIANHKKGISSHQLGRDLNITQKSSWFVLHRIRYAFDHVNFKAKFEEITEADETFIGGKEKNKHRDKKTNGTQGRSVENKAAVAGVLERKSGMVVAKKVADTSAESLHPIVVSHIKEGATLMTDEWTGYNGLKQIYEHHIVRHGEKQYVDGLCHTNNLEGFWSLLKRGIVGIYHSTSKKHLQQYLDEFVFRYNTRAITQYNRFNHYLSQIDGCKLTYKQLTIK